MGTKLLGYPRSTNRSFRIIRLLLPIQLDAAGDAVVLAREDVVLAQWIADPIVGAENAPQVRVAIEDDAEHVVSLALVPVGGAPQIGDAGDVRIVARTKNFDGKFVLEIEAPQIVDDGEFLLGDVVHAGE